MLLFKFLEKSIKINSTILQETKKLYNDTFKLPYFQIYCCIERIQLRITKSNSVKTNKSFLPFKKINISTFSNPEKSLEKS